MPYAFSARNFPHIDDGVAFDLASRPAKATHVADQAASGNLSKGRDPSAVAPMDIFETTAASSST